MRPPKLYCEGEPGKLDDDVLRAVLETKLNVACEIEAVGGNRHVVSCRKAWSEERRQDRVYSIIDRDFRSSQVAEASWAEDSVDFIWRRHEIENYLVEPNVVAAWFHELKATVPAAWTSKLPDDATSVGALIEGFARRRIENHVGKSLYVELPLDVTNYAPTGLSLSPKGLRDKSSSPPTRREWLAELTKQTRRVMQNCSGVANLPEWTEKRMETRYDALLMQRSSDDYWAERRYLSEMEGELLLWDVWRYLHEASERLSDVDGDFVEDGLRMTLRRIYVPGKTFPDDDFVRLAERLRGATAPSGLQPEAGDERA